jgi:hypothetical protein
MSGVSCREFERPLMDRARNRPMDAAVRAALAAHLEVCPGCGKALERQIRLSAAMEVLAESLAESTAAVSAPASVEAAILVELNAVHGRARRRWVYAGMGAALAASLAMVWWLGSARAPKQIEAHAVTALPAAVVRASEAVPVETAAVAGPVKAAPKRRMMSAAKPAVKPQVPFIAIPYTLPLDPRERVDVVRVDMPVAALIAAGLPVGMADPTGQVRTDVLVGQDGRARAVRLVAVASSN